MISITAIGDKTDTGFHVIKRDKLTDALNGLPKGRYIIEVKKAYKKRSVRQNRAKWGIPYKILSDCFTEATGEYVSPDEVHEICKERFLPEEYVEALREEHEKIKNITNSETGEVISEHPFRLTTTKMSTVQEIEYYRNLQAFGREFFECDIPDPNPEWNKEDLKL